MVSALRPLRKARSKRAAAELRTRLAFGSRLIERWSVIGSFAKNPMGQQDTCYVHESSRCNSCRFARNYQEMKLRYGDPRLLEGVEHGEITVRLAAEIAWWNPARSGF